jgi:uridine kinase
MLVDQVLRALSHVATNFPTVTVALDGRSGVGKSTLASRIADDLPSCVVIEGDDFYAGGTGEQWDRRSTHEKVAEVIDWRRQRPVLEAARSGAATSWHGFNWAAFAGVRDEPTILPAAAVVILEGAYSARPELADLFDLRVLLASTNDVRLQRLAEREGDEYRDEWFSRWDEAEEFYFGTVMPPSAFDLVL